MVRQKAAPTLSLEVYAYREIRAMIIRGELEPGEQLIQEDLAARLGVSRTPLRRAIANLAQENFVELTPRGGAFVRSFGPEELVSIFEIRAVLEGLACRLAAPIIAQKHVAYLRSLITSAAEVVTPNDWSAYREADIEFHTYLTNLANDAMLSKVLDSFQILSLALAQGLLRSPGETLQEHLDILEALERRDPDHAEASMKAHIRRSLEHMKRQVERQGVPRDA